MAENPAIERLKQAEAKLDAANEEFGRTCDKIRRRIEVLSRIPAVAAFQKDLDAFVVGVGSVQSALAEFVDALKGVAGER